MAEGERVSSSDTKGCLDEVERGEYQNCLKSQHSKNAIYLWQTEGEKMEAMTDFLYLGSKITVDSDCSHKIKRHLLILRKAMINLDNVLSSRDITSLTKVSIVKAIVFPVVMYSCESWIIRRLSMEELMDLNCTGEYS